MKALLSSLAFCTALIPFSNPVLAADQLKVEDSVEINAKPETVWALVSNFGDMGNWHPAVKSTEILSGTPNLPGAVRVLTLQDGGKFQEELVSYSPAQKTFSYKILGGVLPVSDYQSTFAVKAISETKTKVTWNSTFKRKDPSDNPVAGQTDDDAAQTIRQVYKTGLANLKKLSEGR